MSSYDDRWHQRIERVLDEHHDSLHGNGDGELGLMATVSGLSYWRKNMEERKQIAHTDRVMIICALIGVLALLGQSAYDHINPKPTVVMVASPAQASDVLGTINKR